MVDIAVVAPVVPGSTLIEQTLDDFLQIQAEVGRDFLQNGAKCAERKSFMGRNAYVVLAAFGGR